MDDWSRMCSVHGNKRNRVTLPGDAVVFITSKLEYFFSVAKARIFKISFLVYQKTEQ